MVNRSWPHAASSSGWFRAQRRPPHSARSALLAAGPAANRPKDQGTTEHRLGRHPVPGAVRQEKSLPARRPIVAEAAGPVPCRGLDECSGPRRPHPRPSARDRSSPKRAVPGPADSSLRRTSLPTGPNPSNAPPGRGDATRAKPPRPPPHPIQRPPDGSSTVTMSVTRSARHGLMPLQRYGKP